MAWDKGPVLSLEQFLLTISQSLSKLDSGIGRVKVLSSG